MSMPITGEAAPDLALPDDHGKVHRLADRRGHWTVVYFYPEDDTPGCTTEACQFRDTHATIADADAEVWGISPDAAESHARFRSKFDLPFTLLSDVDHEASTRWGAWGPKKLYGREFLGITRSSFLIDPDGRVVRAWPKVRADGHAAEVVEALTAARGERAAAGR